MSARIPPHIVDEIMNTARIEEVIGEYVQLKKSGSNYKGLSPFTDEKTPSFMVSPAKQIFKCFSTGKGGTVVSFLMEIEQFSYPEALRWLADKYNIQLPEEKPLSEEELQELTERESLQIINTFARDYFVEAMNNTSEGKTVGYSYFKERGFTPQTIEKFQLGYCPQEEKSFTETALEKGYKLTYLEQLGLTKSKEDRHFDFFSSRVIFPIHSVSGKVLGFGGRTLRTDKNIAKYFNSPESILYDKSRTLYGIYFAKNEILKQDNCFLVEGYTDVISLSQAGVENVVSSSGTSLTIGQIKLIQRYTNNITVLYDSDAAGIKASFRGIDMLLEAGLNVKVLLFPEGDDPDSFSKRVSKDELHTYLKENQQDFVGFKTEILLKEANNDPLQKANLIKEIVSSIALIPDAITRSVYLKETAANFDFQEQTLLNELNKIRRTNADKEAGNTAIPTEGLISHPSKKTTLDSENFRRDFLAQEKDVIRLLVLYGSRAIELQDDRKENTDMSVSELIINEIERDQLYFENQLFQEIYSQCREGIAENIFYESQHFLRSSNQKIVQFITDILSTQYEVSGKWFSKYNIDITTEIHLLAQAVKESLYLFKNAHILRRIEEIQDLLKEHASDEEKTRDLLVELIKLEKIRGAFAQQLNRIIL
ncbi:MAG: DNA primase [Brumimicrobium sp.]|nr:DNA primase [Brumimicrobium sp.]